MAERTAASPRELLSDPGHLLALGFGSGCLRPAPGTWGTVVGVAVHAVLVPLSWPSYLIVVALAFAVGVPLCERTSARLGGADNPAIVWDEVVGYLITMLAAPAGWGWWLAGFLLFRLLDIAKPWPIRWFDRNVHGGLGIMLDDAVAGLIGCAVLQIASAMANP